MPEARPFSHLLSVFHNTLAAAWLVLCCVWPSSSAWAEVAPQITFVEGNNPIDLALHSEILLDPEGRYSPDEVAFTDLAKGFKRLGKPLSLGFTSATVWLRLNLSAAQAEEWWLQINQPLMESVTLFERDPAGFWRQQSNHPKHAGMEASIRTRQPTFALQLSPSEPRLLLVRLQSRTSMVSAITLWQPHELHAKTSSESFGWGMVTGAYALVIVFYALFAIWTRERVYALYSTLILINFLAAALTDRWNYDLGLGLSPPAQVTAIGFMVSLAPTASLAFQVAYARIDYYWPRFTRICLALTIAVSAVGLGLAASNQYRLSALLVQSFSILMVVVSSITLTWLSLMGNKRARLLLLAFSIFHLSVGWRYLRNIGYVEPTTLNEHAYQLGAFVHRLILSTGIFSGYNSLRRESERQQAKATAEAQLREQQSQFLGMVAHEVKTPLAVITATADNLQLTADMPSSALQRAEKISRNSLKIQNIFQAYLDNEQVLNSNRAFDFKEVDLGGLIQALAQDFQDTHGNAISLNLQPSIKVKADRQLLSITINNLLSNAYKYASAQSNIGVSTSCSDKHVNIAVTDSGPGIDEQDLPNIFKPYYRGSNSGRQQGTGLGLHLVRYIAEQHRGSAAAFAQSGGGMKFVITLPMPQQSV